MVFKLNAAQFNELQTLRNNFSAPTLGNGQDYAVLYEKVLSYIYSYVDQKGGWANVPNTDINRSSVLWLEGAIGVNRDNSAQSDFIRSYNNLQSQLRYGADVSDTKMSQVSDQIVLDVIDEILGRHLLVDGDIPDIRTIALDDAQPAAQLIFQNEQNPGGWAGNPLFLFLGYQDAFQNNILETPKDTYDLLSVVKFTEQIAVETLSTDFLFWSSAAWFSDTYELLYGAYRTASQVNSQNVIEGNISAAKSFMQNAYGDAIGGLGIFTLFEWDDIYLGNDIANYMDEGDWADDDIIHAGKGDDTIVGSQGDDLIDGGEGNDWIDYRAFDALADNNLYVDFSKHIAITDYILFDDTDYLFNIENIWTGGGNDTIIGNSDIREIDAGSGNDVIVVKGIAPHTTVYGGEGEDTISVGQGTIMYGDAGRDTFLFSKNALAADAGTEDRIMHAGKVLTGGIRWENSESEYAIGRGGMKYGINTDKELVIVNYNDDKMFVANYNRDIDAPHPGNILVGEALLGSFRLLESIPGWLSDTFKALDGILKALYGKSGFAVDPMTVDLDNDGIELLPRLGISPHFDIDGDGFAEKTGWVKGDDGILARDLNGNGKIDSIDEMFGNNTISGFTALKSLDSNNDNKIDAADSAFATLKIWRDLDGDRVTDSGELKTLAEHGIASINLVPTSTAPRDMNGNLIRSTGEYTRSDGTKGTIGDVLFDTNQRDTLWLGDKTISASAGALPEVKGYGTLTDLRIAMTDSPALLQAVQAALPAMNSQNLASLRTGLQPVLTQWMAAVPVPAGTMYHSAYFS